ncbi:response regulator transcription factor [Primorskyibacter marinus]|uniref:response regulator transcription factor n=1 Tax=Primorskyibacter marinus TaxID=1977320 RepID=UPI000E305024|nr:response regulator [Primorskyibacter marinus]
MKEDVVQAACVFLVDDDANIRTSLARALGLRGYQVKAFESARAFLDAYEKTSAGCLILDYGMPQMDGLELQRHLSDRNIKLPIIFITGHGGIPESVQAMKMGAMDFLEKPFKQSVLVERIDAALEIDRKRRDATQRSSAMRIRFESLTDREDEIARLIVSNPGSNSSKDIARHLDISPRTVDHHRARILEKMDVTSVAQLVELALKEGLFKDQ